MKYLTLVLSLFILVACNNNSQSPGTNMTDEFLPVEKAFQFSSKQLDSSTVQLNWVIAEDYHLYKNKFEFSLSPDTARIADVNMPAGVMIDDKTFGKQETYKNQVSIQLKIKPNNSEGPIKLVTKYQGCSIKGLCYPPEKRTTDISI